jgi:hypothetical protein
MDRGTRNNSNLKVEIGQMQIVLSIASWLAFPRASFDIAKAAQVSVARFSEKLTFMPSAIRIYAVPASRVQMPTFA